MVFNLEPDIYLKHIAMINFKANRYSDYVAIPDPKPNTNFVI